jgi:hypothetical protein
MLPRTGSTFITPIRNLTKSPIRPQPYCGLSLPVVVKVPGSPSKPLPDPQVRKTHRKTHRRGNGVRRNREPVKNGAWCRTYCCSHVDHRTSRTWAFRQATHRSSSWARSCCAGQWANERVPDDKWGAVNRAHVAPHCSAPCFSV